MGKKLSRNGLLVRNTLIFAISTVGTKLIQFILVPLYSTYMTAAQFGEADLINTTMSMVYPVFCLGIDQAIIRFGLNRKKGKSDVLKVSINVSAIGALILCILLILLCRVNEIRRYCTFIILIYIGMSLYSILSNYSKTLDKNVIFALSSIINAFVLCVCNILFLVKMNLGVNGYITAVICSYMVSIMFLTVSCRTVSAYKKAKMDFNLAKEMIKYSLPLIPNSFSWWIIQLSDRYMITFFNGITLNGYYTMAYKIPSVFNLLVGIFMQAFDITVFNEVDNGIEKKYTEKIYKYYLSLTFISGSIIMLLIRPIAALVMRNKFYNAWIYVPLLLCAYIVSNLQAFYGVLYGGFKATNISFLTTMHGAITNIVLNLLLIPHFQALGAAVATCISYLVVYIARSQHMKSIFTFDNEYKRIILSLILVFMQALLYMVNHELSTLFCIVVPVIFFIMYRKEFVSLLNMINNKLRKKYGK